MEIKLLGTGGYHPNERRHTTSLLIPELGLAIDAGTGFFRAPALVTTPTLDIFLTHAHLDHIVGLTFILVPVLTGDWETVRVHGAAETLEAVRKHLFAPALFPVEPPFEWVEFKRPSTVTLNESTLVRTCPLTHPGGSTGFSIETSQKRLAVITDTTAPGDYLEFIRGADLLIHECYFGDQMNDWAVKTGHSSASEVARLAREADVGQLALIHVDPQHPEDDPIGMDSIRDIFPNTVLPDDGHTLFL